MQEATKELIDKVKSYGTIDISIINLMWSKLLVPYINSKEITVHYLKKLHYTAIMRYI